VHASEAFWADLNGRGWAVNPQKMVLFRCNACRAREEQLQSEALHAEDLRAQQEEQQRAAAEEKRCLLATRQRLEEAEARRRMRQILLKHEHELLQRELSHAKLELLHAAEWLWPPLFRAQWLAQCSLREASTMSAAIQGAGASGSCRIASPQVRAPLWAELSASMSACQNCGLPGHAAAQCPFPAERLLQRSRNGAGCQRPPCGLCRGSGHVRVQCPELSAEDRREYEARLRALGKVLAALRQVPALEEPVLAHDDGGSANGTISPASALAAAWRRTRAGVQERLCATLLQCGLEHCISESPVSQPPSSLKAQEDAVVGAVLAAPHKRLLGKQPSDPSPQKHSRSEPGVSPP